MEKELRQLTLDDVEQTNKWLFARLANQQRYAGRAFKSNVVSLYVTAAIEQPNNVYCSGVFDGGVLIGLLCGGIAEHPFFDCLVAANVAYQVEAGAGSLLIDDFTKWAQEKGAHEILMGMSAHSDKHDVYKRLMRKQGYYDSDLTFFKVV